MMLGCLWKSCMIWLDVRGEPFQTVCSTMRPAYKETRARHYWFKQRSRLIAMVDTLGLPTIFFTHSAADLQWPELARLICPECSSSRNKAILENPAIADSFFYHRIQKFIEAFRMLVSLVPLTTGCVLSGSIVAAHMYMA